MNNYRIWTAAEEQQLKDLYETATKEQLMSLFNTTWAKIKDKAVKLGKNRQKCKVNEVELCNDYKTGIPLAILWKKYNISNPTILKILAKHNITKRNQSLKNIDMEQFKIDYQMINLPELVDKYDTSRPTIRTLAKQLKLVRPRLFLYKQPILKKQEKKICDEYTNENKSMAMLAEKYDVVPATIMSLLHNNNIDIKTGPYGAAENEVRLFIETMTGKKFDRNKTILNGKEIDMYNEELKIGIEYCGLHWHNEKTGRGANYHQDKHKLCKEKGIHLITMFEDEWLNRKDQVKGVLLSILQKNDQRLYARKCEVKTITKTLGNKFYDDYHIQGKANLSIHFAGLFYLDELVGVMSFGRHHRNTTKYTLDRLCFKSGVSVAGGSQKLFKFLLKETNITELISWSDNRWFQGQVYEKLGFVKDADMNPDYSYVNINNECERISKQSQKKGNTNCPENMTEKEWCAKRGLYRIWDCGKKRWTYKVEQATKD